MSTATIDGPSLPHQDLPEVRFDALRVITFIGMVFGMFMAILDIQIVSASLAEIQAGLSASADEITWVQTSYLIAEVVMIPLSGFLSRAFSTRWLFTASAAGFTVMSFACAQATSIEQMIICRTLQGFIGGGMIPTVFAAAYTIFPPDKRNIVAPIIGLVATLAPTIGPTVGGYLTDLYSWHWLFLINVVPGIIVTAMAWFLIDFDKPNLSMLDNFDWTGLLSMAAFLGALEYILEEGPNKNWFEENAIIYGALISATAAIIFFWRSFTSPNPVVVLRINNRNFWAGCLFSFVLGIGLYGLTYIYPVYLARVRGYSALQIGETLFVSGMAMFAFAPIVGRAMGRIDMRALVALGFLGFGISSWLASGVTKDWAFGELLIPQILRGASLIMCMIPINNIALGAMAPEDVKNASGLFNLTRNLGGAVGLAVINTFLNARTDLHLTRLHEQVTWSNDRAADWLSTLGGAFARLGSDSDQAALKQMATFVRREALVMALSDVFLLVAVIFVSMLIMLPLMRKVTLQGDTGAH